MCTTQSTEEDRRANFVDRLLEEDNFSLTASSSGIDDALPLVDFNVKEKDDLGVVKSNHRAKSMFVIDCICSSFRYLNKISGFYCQKFVSRIYNPPLAVLQKTLI